MAVKKFNQIRENLIKLRVAAVHTDRNSTCSKMENFVHISLHHAFKINNDMDTW